MAKNKYVKIGSVLRSKEDPKQVYLKLSADLEITPRDKDGNAGETVSVSAGQSLNMQTPQSEIAFLVENEHITEEQGEERLDKIPDFVRFNVSAKIPLTDSKPNKGNTTKPKGKVAKASEDDDF